MPDAVTLQTNHELLVQNSEILKKNSLALYEGQELLEEHQCIASTNSATLASNKKTLAANSELLMANHLDLESNKATLAQIRAILAGFHNLLGAQNQNQGSDLPAAAIKADTVANFRALAISHALLETIAVQIKANTEMAKANHDLLMAIAAKIGVTPA